MVIRFFRGTLVDLPSPVSDHRKIGTKSANPYNLLVKFLWYFLWLCARFFRDLLCRHRRRSSPLLVSEEEVFNAMCGRRGGGSDGGLIEATLGREYVEGHPADVFHWLRVPTATKHNPPPSFPVFLVRMHLFFFRA